MSSTASIDGLVSGLNTTQIISQLMQVAAAPQTALKNSQADEQVKVAAYQDVNSKMAALLAAAKSLDTDSTWNAVTASSNDASVTATATDGASTGTFGFDVVKTATYETQLSSSTYSGLGATVTTASSISFTKADGSTVTVTPTDGSLSSVVSAVNGTSGLGIRAAAVAVGNGNYALQLTSSTTGAAAHFTVASGLSMNETTAAGDAELSIPGWTTSTITSSSNTFTNVVPGLTFTVTKPTTGVRIDLASDSSAASKAAKGLVDAANAALDAISKYTAYDPSSKSGGPLTGDWAMRSLQQSILSTVSTAVGGAKSVADAGIQLTQDGHLSFDASKFQTAFTTDATSLRNLLGASATFTPSGSYAGTVSLFGSTETTQEVAGGHSVLITQAASQSTAALTVGTIDATTSLTVGSTTVTGQTGETAADFTARVNAALSGAGYGAALSGSTLTISSTAYGAATGFTPTVAGAGLTLNSVTKGTDVQGSIDGKSGTGTGQILAAGGGSASGMSLLVTLTAADLTGGGGTAGGQLDFHAGVAQRLATLASSATDSVSGSLTNLISSGQSQIKSLGDEIASWDVRLAAQQQALQVQYSNLEVALGKLKDQSTWLAGQIAGLPSHG